MEIWKAFERNGITHSAAHHLMTIHNLLQRNGYARVTDVATSLEITRGSASITLKALRERGLVIEDENKFLRLSDEGERISQAVQTVRQLVRKFLVDVLGVRQKQAEIDACKIEHLLSYETGAKLFRFLKFLSLQRPETISFLETYADFKCSCANSPENCELCEGECLMPAFDAENETL